MITRLDRYDDSFVFDGRSRLGVRETLRIRGTSVNYERWWGPFRLEYATFELLEMKGLLIAVATLSSPQGVPVSDSEIWSRNRKIAGPGLQFWYKVTVRSLAHTLNLNESARLGKELLAYDAGIRESLGLDTAQGLGNPHELTAARMTMAMSGLEETGADRMGRFMG